FCLGSYGNLIVLLSFFDPALRKFRTNFDFMILNLSFCDLFICGVAAPMFAFVLFFDSARGVQGAFCFTFHLTSSGFIIMSLKTVAVIALHRLRIAETFGGPPAPRGPALYRSQGCSKCQQGRTRGCPAHLAQPPAAAPGRPHLGSAVNLSAARDSRAVLTCVVIVLSVLVCCLPLGISLVQDMLSSSSGFVLYQFELCGFTLIFFKSGLNPFIYSRNSAGLRRRVLWCLQYVALVFFCCKQKTRLRAMGKGSLEVNRNKSSHHETNSAYMLSPKPQKKFVDQACGPSHSKESALSPKASVGHQHYAQSSSTPMNTRIEPYYSIYNSSPSQEVSTPNSLQPGNAAFGFAKCYLGMHCHTASDVLRDHDSASAKQIPVPSV
ncbi:putative G-protein coupled receptor 75, partial [Chaetura pelagica]